MASGASDVIHVSVSTSASRRRSSITSWMWWAALDTAERVFSSPKLIGLLAGSWLPWTRVQFDAGDDEHSDDDDRRRRVGRRSWSKHCDDFIDVQQAVVAVRVNR